MFGAVAIGGNIESWQWDRVAAVELAELRRGITDMNDRAHRTVFECCLDHVKAKGD